MNCFYQWGVAFDNPQSARHIYSTRCWSEYGYSRKDKLLPNDQDEFIAYRDLDNKRYNTVKKIYPNDPCPCGSGKKYKKCCGKK